MANRSTCTKFTGRWRVIAGDMRGEPGSGEKGYALLEPLDERGERFRLCSLVGDDCMTLQTLRATAPGVLEQCDEERGEKPWLPLRCLVLWCPKGQNRLILAMRKKGHGPEGGPDPSTYLAPWEWADGASPNDTGTWGAEEEAGDGSQSPSSRNDAQK